MSTLPHTAAGTDRATDSTTVRRRGRPWPHRPAEPPLSPRSRLRDRRHRAAAVSLVLGAAAMGIAETVHPRGGADGAAGLLREFAERPGTWILWSLLIMATALLQLPGVLAWRARVDAGRGSRLLGAGGLVLAGGLVALFGFGSSHGEGVALAGPLPIDPAVEEAYTRADQSVTVGLTIVIALLGFHLGWVLFLAGLARAGVLPWWVAAVGAVGSIGVLPFSGVWSAAETFGFWLLAAAIAWSAVALFRSTRVAHPGG